MKNIIFLLLSFCMITVGPRVNAGSATWNLNPTSNLWNTPENWTPTTVPDGETDVASFSVSTITDITNDGATDLQHADTDLFEIVFAADASAYTIRTTPNSTTTYSRFIVFWGAGIINDSGNRQNFINQAAAKPGQHDPGAIWFLGPSSAGENVVITNQGGALSDTGGGYTKFGLYIADTPSAGKATVNNEGSKVSGGLVGGNTYLVSYSTAEAATFINQPGVVAGAGAGFTYVNTGGNIGTSTFVNNAATVTGAEGGWTELDNAVCAGNSFIAYGATSAGPQGGQVYIYGGGGTGYASFTATGGQGSGAQGGLIEIHNIPDSSQTVVTAEGGTSGGLGGMITINDAPVSLDQVQFQLLGNGTMDLSALHQPSAIIGSLSGEGTVSLTNRFLDIGSNNLDTTFSGVLQDRGGVIKSGSGTLTLSGPNIYRGGTTVKAGALIVSNASGSGTGTGSVAVNGGTLGGGGTITGPVTVGTGSGSGATFQPSFGTNNKITLTIQGLLTFKSNAIYNFHLKTKKSEVVANGLTIENGAQFVLSGPNRRLPAGGKITVISNTSASPISGTFANLPDGGTITSGSNTFQVSYQGGTGNDLTLTVVP